MCTGKRKSVVRTEWMGSLGSLWACVSPGKRDGKAGAPLGRAGKPSGGAPASEVCSGS